jgi:uncharacterized protein YabE (DUF348 family)
MKRKTTLLLLAAALLLSGILLLGGQLHKSVSLVVDGESSHVSTWALTVGRLLEQQGITRIPQDRLWPPENHWLAEGQIIRLERAAGIRLLDGERVKTVLTAERLAGNILAEAGLALYPQDRLEHNGAAIPADTTLDPGSSNTLQLKRAVPVTINLPGDKLQIYSSATTLGEALREAGIRLEENDDLEPAASTPLTGPIEARFQPAREISVQVGKSTLKSSTTADTVGEALAEAGLPLQGLDYSRPAAEVKLPADGRIEIVRVREEVLINQAPLAYETEFQPDPNLEIDNQRILETGVVGVQAQQVRVRLENGQETARSVEAEWLAREPSNQVIGYGTQITKKTTTVGGTTIEYWRAVPMYATSYSPCRLGVRNYCNDVTASGMKLQKGVAGVAKSWYNYTVGQRVFVPGYGTATIADFGNGLPGRYLIDLGFSEEDFEIWHQDVTVYFLWPPPPPEQIMWTLP